MCRYMRSHFQNWINYNGATFSLELLSDRTFIQLGRALKMGRFLLD